MTLNLQRLAQPQHRLWLAAALLALVAGVLAQTFPPQPVQPSPRGNLQLGSGPAESLVSLLEITADPRLLISEAEAAKAANAALPLITGGLQQPPAFGLPAGIDLTGADRARQCLALAIYYEAAFEGEGGRRAVAQVVLNRVRHPAFPKNVCGVVFQRSTGNVCQFTFACDGAMARPPLPALWHKALREASEALAGRVYAPVGMATHYHADYVFPHWAPRLDKIAVIGTHVFYRWPGGWGLARAFTAAYQGDEPVLAELALPGHEAPPEPQFPPEFAAAANEVAPLRAENEGGFVDPGKGWIPRIAQQPDAGAEPLAAPQTSLVASGGAKTPPAP